MSGMAIAGPGIQTACSTSKTFSVSKTHVNERRKGEKIVAYIWSPHAPRAGSYNPPGTGLFSESSVGVLYISLTEIVLISSLERTLKSTPSIDEEIGRVKLAISSEIPRLLLLKLL